MQEGISVCILKFLIIFSHKNNNMAAVRPEISVPIIKFNI